MMTMPGLHRQALETLLCPNAPCFKLLHFDGYQRRRNGFDLPRDAQLMMLDND